MQGWNASKNNKYEVNNYNGNLIANQPIIFKDKKSSVCLVSCHGVNHYKGVLESDVKVADLYTGSIVEVISELVGSSFVSNVCRTPLINPYLGMTAIESWLKKKLEQNPELLVIDVHGCKNNSSFDFAFGTCVSSPTLKVQNAITLITDKLNSKGIRTTLNPRGYSAKSRYTLTRSLIKMGYENVLQVEVSRRFREPKEKLSLTLDLLAQAIKKVKNEL